MLVPADSKPFTNQNIANPLYFQFKHCNLNYVSDTMKCNCQKAMPDANSHTYLTNFVQTAKINAINTKKPNQHRC